MCRKFTEICVEAIVKPVFSYRRKTRICILRAYNTASQVGRKESYPYFILSHNVPNVSDTSRLRRQAFAVSAWIKEQGYQ